MEEIELNSRQWRQLAKQLDNESRRTESFPVQKRLRRQADDALRRAVALETAEALAKGDVSGHEFHGNQYGGGGTPTHASNIKAGDKISVDQNRTALGSNRMSAPREVKSVTHSPSARTASVKYADASNKYETEHIDYGTHVEVHKGDVSGHDFHGNQYGGGGGGSRAETDGLRSGPSSPEHDLHQTVNERPGWTKTSGTSATHESGGKVSAKADDRFRAEPAKGETKYFYSAQSAVNHVERNK